MKRAARSTLFLLSLAFAAGACSNLSQLSSRKPQEEADFNSRLAAEYLAYAQSESEQGQKEDAEYYASKGLRAEKGEAVEPEKVPASFKRKKTLNAARGRMLKAMTPTAKSAAPQIAARTQLLFDCWLDQQLETESKEIISCGQEFNQSVGDLEKAARGQKTTVVE